MISISKSINKVVYGDRTLIDLTSDTVTPETMIVGSRAHDSSGTVIDGTIPEKNANNVTGEGETVTVASGYYATSVSKSLSDLGISTHTYTPVTDTVGSAVEGNTLTATHIDSWVEGVSPELGNSISASDIGAWERGLAASAQISAGVLSITDGIAPELSYSAKLIPNIVSVGRVPTLTKTDVSFHEVDVVPKTVVVDLIDSGSGGGGGGSETSSNYAFTDSGSGTIIITEIA